MKKEIICIEGILFDKGKFSVKRNKEGLYYISYGNRMLEYFFQEKEGAKRELKELLEGCGKIQIRKALLKMYFEFCLDIIIPDIFVLESHKVGLEDFSLVVSYNINEIEIKNFTISEFPFYSIQLDYDKDKVNLTNKVLEKLGMIPFPNLCWKKCPKWQFRECYLVQSLEGQCLLIAHSFSAPILQDFSF